MECYRPGLAEIKPHTHIAKVVVKVVESGIAGCKIRNTAQENPESAAWNPEFKTVLDSLALVDLSGEQHSRSSCRTFFEGKLSSSRGIIKENLLIK